MTTIVFIMWALIMKKAGTSLRRRVAKAID
jgi:hypothetical protein